MENHHEKRYGPSDLIWKKEIMEIIEDFSDIDYQKDNWILSKNPDILSSYEESVNMLYDDIHFEDFLTACRQRKVVSDMTLYYMDIFKKNLDLHMKLYDAEPTRLEDLNTESWRKVVRAAKKAHYGLSQELDAEI